MNTNSRESAGRDAACPALSGVNSASYAFVHTNVEGHAPSWPHFPNGRACAALAASPPRRRDRARPSGDRAYAVVNATYKWKQNGKPHKEAAIWMFSLVKTKDGWRITGWAWSKS